MGKVWASLTGTLRELWSTGRGRFVVIATGALTLIVIGAIVAMNVAIAPAATTPAPATQSGPSEDLFPGASAETPESGGAPVIMDNGQVDIGGPGIPANVDGWIEPDAPEAKPGAESGLASWPSGVPLDELTIPSYTEVTVAECAAPQIPEARAMANDIVAYLFTWDSRLASFDEWGAPVDREWNRLFGYYGGEGMNGKGDAGRLEDRFTSIGASESAWTGWARNGVRSEVRVNQVVTTAPHRSLLQLDYTVTITRAGDGLAAESAVETVTIVLTAPCAHDNWPSPASRWDMTGLQLFDFRGWGSE